MFTQKIKELTTMIETAQNTISAKTTELKEVLNAGDLEKGKALKEEINAEKEALKEAEDNLELYKAAAKGDSSIAPGKKVTENEMTYRDKVNNFLRTGEKFDGLRMASDEGATEATANEVLIPFNEITPTTDGVVKIDSKPVTSEEISYTPNREVQTVVDLQQFTTIHKATKGSGSYPILKNATTKMVSVAELEKNPKLAKPEFGKVNWEVETYRGAIPISQESIDDADVDLVGIVAENAQQIKVNTTNAGVSDVMKTFSAKTVKNVDDIKAILNVDLDPAYNVAFVVSQSFYQILDTLKDGNGRYLMQDSITSATGKVLLDKPVFVLPDTLLGKAGEAKAFVGDVKRAILFVLRKDLGLRWADNEIYGQYLQAVIRFDCEKADEKAGYFVTFTPETTSTGK